RRLSCRNLTIARSSGAICHMSPTLLFDQELNRQPALNLELAVDPGLRLLQHGAGQIGGDNLDAPPGERVFQLLERHGERIGLLSAGGSGRPDANAARGAARGEERWNLRRRG